MQDTVMSTRKMIMVGGKGGVGKTTCAAAIAVEFASSGRNTLIITSDMTPSLSDIFETPIGDIIKNIDKNLSAVEISQQSVMTRWKSKFGPDFYDILSRLIDVEGFDSQSQHELMDYIGSAPSLREETLLDIIIELAESGGYDRVVWDTAPAGETLNLLNMPRHIKSHIRAGARVYESLDKIRSHVTGKKTISEIMDKWILASEIITKYIKANAAFILVATPEFLVVRQVDRIIKNLLDYQIGIDGIIINRVIKQADSVTLQTLSDVQQSHIKELAEMAKGLPVAAIPLSLKEIRGIKALSEVGKIIASTQGLL